MADNFLLNFKEDKETDKVYFVGNYMEIYIPYNYFELHMADIIDEKIETLGIFIIRVFKDADKKDNSINHIYKFPTKITTIPSDRKKEKLKINGVVDEYLVLKYYKGDVFLNSTVYVESASFVVDFINLVNKGKLPRFLQYDDAVKLELKSIELNEVGYEVPGTILELIASEIQRDASDITKPYRYKVTNKTNKNFLPVSIQSLPSQNGTFSSVTFENIDYQLISSINKTKYNKNETVSPLEKTIKY